MVHYRQWNGADAVIVLDWKHTQAYMYLQSWRNGSVWQLICCHTSGPEDKNTSSVLFYYGDTEEGRVKARQQQQRRQTLIEVNMAVVKMNSALIRSSMQRALCLMEQKGCQSFKALTVWAHLYLCDISGCHESFGERDTTAIVLQYLVVMQESLAGCAVRPKALLKKTWGETWGTKTMLTYFTIK